MDSYYFQRLKTSWRRVHNLAMRRGARCERHFNGCAACVYGSDCRTASRLIRLARNARGTAARILGVIKRNRRKVAA